MNETGAQATESLANLDAYNESELGIEYSIMS
jgi:hypothetical protein